MLFWGNMAKANHPRPYTSRRSSMTYFSKHDPVRLPQGQTDHWTNMKLKCTTVQVAMPSGKVLNRAGSAPTSVPKDQWIATFQYNPDGSLSRLEDHTFSDILVDKLNGTLPGGYDKERKKSNGPKSNRLRTSYNIKAKEGFNYWNIERPKPTSFGKVGIGAANTILGIGNAVRT